MEVFVTFVKLWSCEAVKLSKTEMINTEEIKESLRARENDNLNSSSLY